MTVLSFLLLLLLNPFPADAGTETITYDYYNSRAVKSALYSTATSGTMFVYSYDNSGNMTRKTVDFSPDTTITSKPSSLTNSRTAAFSFTSSKTGSTFECKRDSGDYIACTSPKQYTNLGNGNHTFYVRSIDSFGNPDPTPAEYTWKIDYTSPSSTIVYPSGSFIMANTVTISGTASDIGSNVSKVEIKINSGAWTHATGTTSWTYNWTVPADGTYTIQSRATDAAGNVETPSDGITIAAYKRAPLSVTINAGKQLLINSIPFTVKGINYSPVPIGDDPETTPPYGDYFTSGYANIYTRDLPLLRSMGANTVRLWTWDDTADHHDFLDNAYNSGTNPIYVIAGFQINQGLDISLPTVRDRIKADFREMVAINKNHPAILMWAIGNELNSSYMYGSNMNNLFSLVNEMAQEAHLEDGNHPVTIPLADENLTNTISAYNSSVPNLDIWGANIYRGNSFGTLFSSYSTASSKPLLITEYGIDAYNNTSLSEDQSAQSNHAGVLWQEISANSASCVGGVYKEFSDQWWAGSQSTDIGCPETNNPNVHGTCGAVNSGFPDSYDNYEWWGLMSIVDNGNNPDIVSTRVAYNTLQSLWTAPITPSELTAKPTSTTSIVLSWKDNATNETGFKVERKSGDCASANSWSQITTKTANTTTHTNSGLTANTTYSFRVRAYNSVGNSSYTSCASATTGLTGTPAAPTGLKATSASASLINLAWTDNSTDETNFKIYRKTNSGTFSLLYTTAANIVSYSNTTAAGNDLTNTYSYYISACNAAGCSPATNTAAVPFKPTSISTSAVSSTQINLSWTDNSSNETGFEIYRKAGNCSSTNTWTLINTTAANAANFNNTGLTSGQTYSYRLRAFNISTAAPYANGYSAYTGCSSKTTP
jgi:hypothetical protein